MDQLQHHLDGELYAELIASRQGLEARAGVKVACRALCTVTPGPMSSRSSLSSTS
jgi:hypothetical protein